MIMVVVMTSVRNLMSRSVFSNVILDHCKMGPVLLWWLRSVRDVGSIHFASDINGNNYASHKYSQ